MTLDTRSAKLLADVRPELASRVLRVLYAMTALGFPMTVTDGNRTVEQQKKLYAQGRTTPGRIVTNADGVKKKSNHQDGRAVDCTFLDAAGKPHWPENGAWAAYGACAKAVGLRWGGDFKSIKDRPHVELP